MVVVVCGGFLCVLGTGQIGFSWSKCAFGVRGLMRIRFGPFQGDAETPPRTTTPTAGWIHGDKATGGHSRSIRQHKGQGM